MKSQRLAGVERALRRLPSVSPPTAPTPTPTASRRDHLTSDEKRSRLAFLLLKGKSGGRAPSDVEVRSLVSNGGLAAMVRGSRSRVESVITSNDNTNAQKGTS